MPVLETSAPAVRLPSVNRSREGSRAWAVAAVFIAGIVAVGVPTGYVVMKWGGAMVDGPAKVSGALARAAADAMRPRLTVSEVVMNSVQQLRKENKLVVFTADISADVTRQEGSSAWGIYWGTNVSRVAVRDAKVQFVIDLSKLQTSDVIYDDHAKMLTLFLPRPTIDAAMVAIDPGKIQTLDLRGGWARFDKSDTLGHAIAELRPQVLTQAEAPFVRELAQSAGIDAATKLLGPLAGALSHDGMDIRVTYRE